MCDCVCVFVYVCVCVYLRRTGMAGESGSEKSTLCTLQGRDSGCGRHNIMMSPQRVRFSVQSCAFGFVCVHFFLSVDLFFVYEREIQSSIYKTYSRIASWSSIASQLSQLRRQYKSTGTLKASSL